MQYKTLSIIGLGKLGLPLALSFASKGFSVIGYDINKETVNKLQSGLSPISEPFVQKMLLKNKAHITFTQIAEDIIQKSDCSFIVVPTPSKKDGSFSSEYIEKAIKAFIPSLKKKKQKHIFVITSTISPETMKKTLKPLIEHGTGKTIGKDIGLCYSPELIALGSVVQNITHPDFLLIGESEKETGNIVKQLRKCICANDPIIIHTNWINAELIKLSLNAYITTKISFANMIARISERIVGADSDIILNAIGQDSRIGTKYLKGGLGFGGPCFPRDNISLYSTIKKVGLNINLPLNIDIFNKDQINYIYRIIKKYSKNNDVLGILGLSYKTDTDVVQESQGMMLAKKLVKEGVPLIVFDPVAQDNAKKELKKTQFAKNIEDCIKNTSLIIIATQWTQFQDINWDKWHGKVIIDCWRHIDLSKYSQLQNTFVQLGRYIPQ